MTLGAGYQPSISTRVEALLIDGDLDKPWRPAMTCVGQMVARGCSVDACMARFEGTMLGLDLRRTWGVEYDSRFWNLYDEAAFGLDPRMALFDAMKRWPKGIAGGSARTVLYALLFLERRAGKLGRPFTASQAELSDLSGIASSESIRRATRALQQLRMIEQVPTHRGETHRWQVQTPTHSSLADVEEQKSGERSAPLDPVPFLHDLWSRGSGGLGPHAQRTHEYLLANPGARRHEIARDLALSASGVSRNDPASPGLLQRMQRDGLVRPDGRRWFAIETDYDAVAATTDVLGRRARIRSANEAKRVARAFDLGATHGADHPPNVDAETGQVLPVHHLEPRRRSGRRTAA